MYDSFLKTTLGLLVFFFRFYLAGFWVGHASKRERESACSGQSSSSSRAVAVRVVGILLAAEAQSPSCQPTYPPRSAKNVLRSCRSFGSTAGGGSASATCHTPHCCYEYDIPGIHTYVLVHQTSKETRTVPQESNRVRGLFRRLTTDGGKSDYIICRLFYRII